MLPSYDVVDTSAVVTIPGTLVFTCTVSWPPPIPDDRYNPKMQAKWFREMVCAIVGAARGQTGNMEAVKPTGFVALPFRRIRAGPFLERGWKMKLWKQAHA
jgi:hypothetical protein